MKNVVSASVLAVGLAWLAGSSQAQVVPAPVASWSFSTGTSADLTSSNGLYTFSVGGAAPTYNTGSISLAANTELVASGINTTSIPTLVSNSTIWVRMEFDSVPNITGFIFGLVNATAPADWGQMSNVAWYVNDNTSLGNYGHTATGEYGQSGVTPPAVDTSFTMALVFTSGQDQNGFPSATYSRFQTFINGVQVLSGSAQGLALQNSLGLALGQLKASGGVAGMTFDEVQIYDQSLTAAQIAAIPEPGSLALCGGALALGAVFLRRTFNRRA